jgi:hypothetical protein
MEMDHHHHQDPGEPEPPVGVHGMLLVGEAPIYLSHLPMFMAPHNYQIILKVQLDDEAAGRLHDFRAHFGRDFMFTVKPETFTVTDLVPDDDGQAALTSFDAELVKGHFEKGGDPIAEHARVTVADVVHFQELGQADSKSIDLEYILFGAGEQFFLAHWITRPPDFDQVLAVNVTGHEYTEDEQDREHFGVLVTIGAHQFEDLQIEVLSEIYFEEGELRKQPTFTPTEEEKESGFGS